MQLLQELVFNFLLWWYIEQFVFLLQTERNYLRLIANLTGLSIHSRFLFTPFYKDYSLIGRGFAFIVRSFIVIFGIIIEFIAISILIALNILYIFFPVLPIIKLWLAILHI